MLVKELVTSDIQLIGDDTTIQQAAEIMRIHNQHTLGVSQNGECVGVVTSKEIIERAVARGVDPTIGRVADIMSRKVVRCYDDEDLTQAALSMQANDVSALVVMDRMERPTGVISFGDLMMGAVFVATLDMQRRTTDGPMH